MKCHSLQLLKSFSNENRSDHFSSMYDIKQWCVRCIWRMERGEKMENRTNLHIFCLCSTYKLQVSSIIKCKIWSNVLCFFMETFQCSMPWCLMLKMSVSHWKCQHKHSVAGFRKCGHTKYPIFIAKWYS